MNRIQLMQGDCIERMKEIPDGSVDMVLTDPPYGMGFQSNYAKSGPRHKKLVGDEVVNSDWINQVIRLMKPDGGFAMFCDWKTSCEWRHLIEKSGLKLVSQVIWDREHHGMGDLRGAYAPMHDVIWYATKGRRVFTNGRPKSVLRHKRPSPSEDNGHPTCKPLSLMEELVTIHGEGTYLDPFMGSGTTGVAAVKLGCGFIGIEIDSEYFAIAKKRIDGARYDS